MLSNEGNYYFPNGFYFLQNRDEQLLQKMFEIYFADDLVFDEIIQPEQTGKRTFKKKCGSSTAKIGNISYL